MSRIEQLYLELQGAQAYALHETQLRQKAETAYQNPNAFDEEIHDLRLTIQSLGKFGEEAKH